MALACLLCFCAPLLEAMWDYLYVGATEPRVVKERRNLHTFAGMYISPRCVLLILSLSVAPLVVGCPPSFPFVSLSFRPRHVL